MSQGKKEQSKVSPFFARGLEYIQEPTAGKRVSCEDPTKGAEITVDGITRGIH